MKVSGNLWQYCKDIPAVNNNGDIVDFNRANATNSFNFKAKIKGQTDDDGETNNAEIMVPLKYLINFWRTREMSLIIVNLILFWLDLQILLSCILMLQIKVLHSQ